MIFGLQYCTAVYPISTNSSAGSARSCTAQLADSAMSWWGRQLLKSAGQTASGSASPSPTATGGTQSEQANRQADLKCIIITQIVLSLPYFLIQIFANMSTRK